MTDIFSLIGEILKSGITWSTLVAVIVTISSFKDKRRNNRMLYLIGERLGIEWKSSLPMNGFVIQLPQLSKKLYLFSRKDMSQSPRRKNMLTTILKANLSKKLISALVAMAIVSLNGYFNLNIPQDYVWGVLGLSLSHISLQTIIDSIKAWALSKATMVVRTMPTVETVIQKIIADPNTSYTNMIPVINDVHNTFTSFLADMKKGKVTDATREAMSAYLTVQAYLQTIKPTPAIEPATTIPEQVGA